MESDIFLRWQAILFTIDGPKMLFQNLQFRVTFNTGQQSYRLLLRNFVVNKNIFFTPTVLCRAAWHTKLVEMGLCIIPLYFFPNKRAIDMFKNFRDA